MAQKIRVGIIGGKWGLEANLPAFRAFPDLYEVVAICTAHQETAEAAAKEHGIALPFWDWNELVCHPDIDLVNVSLRPSGNYDKALRALQNGKHVRSEDPACMTSAQARQLWLTARDMGLKAQVNYQLLTYSAAGMRMAELMADGYIGQPLHARAEYFMPMAFEEGRTKYHWLADADNGASALRNTGGHILEFMRQILGEVTDVVGVTDIAIPEWITSPDRHRIAVTAHDSVAYLARLGGTLTTIQASWSAIHGDDPTAEVYGSQGRLTLQRDLRERDLNGVPTLKLYGGNTNGSLERIDTPWPSALQAACTYDLTTPSEPGLVPDLAAQVFDLGMAILNDHVPGQDFYTGYRLMKVFEAVEMSSRERRWVTIDPA